MSTYYYDLKEPWGRLEVDKTADQYRLALWDSHGRADCNRSRDSEPGPA